MTVCGRGTGIYMEATLTLSTLEFRDPDRAIIGSMDV